MINLFVFYMLKIRFYSVGKWFKTFCYQLKQVYSKTGDIIVFLLPLFNNESAWANELKDITLTLCYNIDCFNVYE